MQNFKGDDLELKMIACAQPILDNLSSQKSTFFNECYNCFKLGEMLYDNDLAPLAKVISRDVYREIFSAIFDQFITAGSAESYMTIFRDIFGADVQVVFTVPAYGKLNIAVTATGIELKNLAVREIVDNQYVTSDVITQDGADNIVLQSVKGFTSQYELEQMLKEMIPSGIFPTITLTIGS